MPDDERKLPPRMGRRVSFRGENSDGAFVVVQEITFDGKEAGNLTWCPSMEETPFLATKPNGQHLILGDYFTCKQALLDQVTI